TSTATSSMLRPPVGVNVATGCQACTARATSSRGSGRAQVVEEVGGEVALHPVAGDRGDVVAGAQRAGQAAGARQVQAAGGPDREPPGGELAGGGHRLGPGDGDGRVPAEGLLVEQPRQAV